MSTVARDARRFFVRAFGGEPELVVSAAGRVNLIGEHVDYNGGIALPIAIQRRTAVAIRRHREGRWTRIQSGGNGGVLKIDHAKLARCKRWTDYPAGVLDQLMEAQHDLPGFDVALASNIPSGSGLSSSAALEVGFDFAVRTILGLDTARIPLALECQRAEREFVGVPCGAMDQLSAACGQAGNALHMSFAPVRVHPVPFREKVLVFNTAVPRGVRSSAYRERVAECAEALTAIQRSDPTVATLADASLEQVEVMPMAEVPRQRARHVVTECDRVRRVVDALTAGALFPGELAVESHRSLREAYECSSRELDWVVDTAMQTSGVRGARLTGAGWGGCAIVFGDESALLNLQETLPLHYEATMGHRGRAWLVSADDGVRVEP